jgi:hypothetical protein
MRRTEVFVRREKDRKAKRGKRVPMKMAGTSMIYGDR